MPKIKEELITIKKFKIEGVYSDERKDKHRIIITNKIKDKEPNEKAAILLGGGSGAGKSSIVKQFFLPEVEDFDSNSDFVYIDADQIKLELDEYHEYIKDEDTVYFAAFYVHEESGDIVNMLLEKCIELDLSFIYDGTMSWPPLYDELLPKLKKSSYHTLGVYVDVELKVALHRAKKRGKKEKRYVAASVVKKANRNSAILFKNLKPQFDEVMMINNTADRNEESKPYEPFYRRETQFTELFKDGEIHHPEHLDVFIKKANQPYIK